MAGTLPVQRLQQGFLFPTVGYWGDAGIPGGIAEALRIARQAAGRND
jgi:4-hydroxy-2-oxoheptanedioate aldolase